MILRLLNRKNQLIGRLDVTLEKVNLVGGDREILMPLIENVNREGATYRADVFDGRSFVMMERKAEPGSENFPSAVREYLERLGYEVIQEHPEVENEIRAILNKFPDSNPDRKAILEDLPSMSYLEQTLLLEELKEEKI